MSRTDHLKLLGGVVAVALVLVLLWSLSPLLVGWPLALYVCWRALPAIRCDVAAVRRRFFPARSWRF